MNDKHVISVMYSTCNSSGTEEEITEKLQLLQEVSDFFRDAMNDADKQNENIKVGTNRKEDDRKRKGEKLREAAMVKMVKHDKSVDSDSGSDFVTYVVRDTSFCAIAGNSTTCSTNISIRVVGLL